MAKTRKWSLACVLVVVGLLVAACGGIMVKSTLPTAVNPGSARIYFIFPTHSVMGIGAGAAYVTEETKLVGLISNRQAFHVDVAPGKHLFMALMSNTDAVEIDAAAGKTYYVVVSSAPNPIPYASPLTYLSPLTPGAGQWNMRNEWLGAVTFLQYDPERGANWEKKYFDKNTERVANIRSGKASCKVMTADQGE